VEALRNEVGVAQHEATGNTAMSGIRPEDLSRLNRAEDRMFVAAIASLVPGINPEFERARRAVNQAYHLAYGGGFDDTSCSLSLIENINRVFDLYGLKSVRIRIK
jgi:hypothetical protein